MENKIVDGFVPLFGGVELPGLQAGGQVKQKDRVIETACLFVEVFLEFTTSGQGE